MKTISKKSLTAVILFSIISFASFVHADTTIKNKDLAINFSSFDFFNFNEEKTEASTTEITVEDVTPLPPEPIKDSCEHFDSTSDNLMILESASAEARIKIENVEETIDTEVSVRENIFDSVKGLLGLQKKDRIIFREMKKDISDAKIYYDDLDITIASTTTYLNESVCEKIKVTEAKKIDIDTEDLVQDESTFRKQFVGSLKEKVKILQTSVKEAKK